MFDILVMTGIFFDGSKCPHQFYAKYPNEHSCKIGPVVSEESFQKMFMATTEASDGNSSHGHSKKNYRASHNVSGTMCLN